MPPVDFSKLPAVAETVLPDTQDLLSQLVATHQPRVIRGLVSGWPLVAAGRNSPQAVCDLIRRHSYEKPVTAFFGPPEIDGRFFYSDDLRGFNYEQRQLPLSQLLDRLLATVDQDRPESIYAGAVPVREHLAGLLTDNDLDAFDSDQERLVSLWIGNRSRTAPHWDLPHNIACVAAGTRRFTLFPPEQLPNMYSGPLEFTPAGQPISLVDLHEPDFREFPRFAEALEHSQVAVLEPGDALFVPSMWWHHVECLSPLGVMMNHWWREAEAYMFTPLFTLFHGLLSIRDMPAAEREIWRGVFDHYIFQTNGDPVAHLPEGARGVLGKMTRENVNRLRAHLIRSLGGKL